MKPSKITLICILLLACASAWAQTNASNIQGTLVDPGNAVIPNIQVQLTDQATGAVHTTVSTNVGLFRFPQVLPGTYTLSVKAQGFKAYTNKDIIISTGETRDLGNIVLALGTAVEAVEVTAAATPVQTASSEKSVLVDAGELTNIAVRGRDEFAMLGFLPGIIDGSATTRESEASYTVQSIVINGNSAWTNATIDGQANMDVGCGYCLTQGNPNMDAVQEVKVLTSNYQAEFGRNSGGTITLVTKSGSREFHGSGWWTHRHEEFNANSWSNDKNNVQLPKYRYNVQGWSLGGPFYIPGLVNKSKKKVFFFASQEFTRQFVPNSGSGIVNGIQYTTLPTDLERKGDFSKSYNINGALIPIIDPTTKTTATPAGTPYPNNVIPPTLMSKLGEEFLAFLPEPNYFPTSGNANYLRYNYFSNATGAHPRDDHVIRLDTYLTNKLSGWFRYVRNSDDQTIPFGGSSFTYGAQEHPMPDFAMGGSLAYTISPNLINEFTTGRTGSTWDYWIMDPTTVARSLIPGLPLLFPKVWSDASQLYNYLPTFSFGGTPNSAASYGYGSASRYNPVHNDVYNDNLSWVTGKHSFKAGIAVERAYKLQPQGSPMAALGNYGFGTSSTNPLDTGDGFAKGGG